ncbi:MAG: family 16 glycoside hydrolase, partial [Dermatophilaceae bacterium]
MHLSTLRARHARATAVALVGVATAAAVAVVLPAPTVATSAANTAAQASPAATTSAKPPAQPPAAQAAQAPTASAADGFVNIFNGRNLNGWYTYLPSQGKNTDPEGVFEASNGELRILDVPVTGKDREFGYLATTKEYRDYHLRFQYKWGDKKFAPRDKQLRDSGLLYHLTGKDKVWPTSLESQVQEGDTGDLITLGGPTVDITTAPGSSTYKAGGELRKGVSGKFAASTVADTLEGWNTVEVVVRGNTSTHIVNGKTVSRSTNQTLNGRPLEQGRIAIQAEGAEVTYRNIQMKSLTAATQAKAAATPAPAPAAAQAAPQARAQAAPRILAFSKTGGFKHTSIPAALDAIDTLGQQNGF